MDEGPLPPEKRPCVLCDYRGCELYPGDSYFIVDGLLVCEDCLIPFIRQWLAPCRRVAGEEDAFCTP